MKRFDDILVKRIKEAFSKYDADHLADQGWNAFQRANRKKRPGIVIPLWAKAASVAVLITGAGLVMYKTFFATVEQYEEVPVITEQIKVPGEEVGKDPVITKPEVNGKLSDLAEHASEPTLSDNIKRDENVTKEPVNSDYIEIEKMPVRLSDLNLPGDNEFIPANAVGPGRISHYNPLAETLPATEKKKTELLAGLSGMIARIDNGVTSDPGTSMGVYIERKLSDRISFRPGIAFAIQGYNLTGNNALEKNLEYSSQTALANDAASVDVENTDAQLNFLAFEIPLNFVFTIWERKNSKIYLSTGASTMVYLNQKFDGSFTNTYTQERYNSATGDVTYKTNFSLVDVENKYGAFSHVDFLGLANLSAGYEMPVGKSNKIFFEPFIKIPLSPLTSLDLHVVYGGISLKLRFLDQK